MKGKGALQAEEVLVAGVGGDRVGKQRLVLSEVNLRNFEVFQRCG